MKAVLALAFMIGLLGVAGCGGDDGEDGETAATPAETTGLATEGTATEGTATGTSGAVDGAAVFASAGCGSCHTLAAADATGNVGPNLDELEPDQETVEEQVRNGGGTMPAFEGELSDDEIAAVAEFVATSAGG